ncbi:ATP-binding cassette domain-containing protein [Candidatus Saccharibacteria bacterium]|nr:ATP-binding cassette domain-containing protein [Candidatus Saccharibacteria bacterium]
MDEPAIIVSEVSKAFKLPHEKHGSFKSLFVNLFRGRRTYERQQVLKNVSFEIKKGEFFGIVGRNGGGKSTLLKLLAGIYTPDSGAVVVNGKLTPFIELGVGFNPELTGRENVYLNGALLGFSRKEMEAMYSDIVEFAEIDKFMDQKLKNYSSGMQVRLAFSIAIRAKTDILLIDEVLAVGDAGFQAKCFNYFRRLKSEKQTVVFVSHDMESVQRFCDRALLIDKGDIKIAGDPRVVAAQYSLNSAPSSSNEEKAIIGSSAKEFEIQKVTIDKQSKSLTPKDTVRFTIHYRIKQKLAYDIGISIMKGGISLHERNTKDIKLPVSKGEHHLVWEAEAALLSKGLYIINVTAFNNDFKPIALIVDAESFFVEHADPTIGGLVNMGSKWSIGK